MSAQRSDVESELERLRAIKAGPPPLSPEEWRRRMDEKCARPHASIARFGVSFAWAVWPSSAAAYDGSSHIAEGVAPSMEEAKAQIGARFTEFEICSNGPVQELRHRRAVERRAARAPTGAAQAKPLEFLYRWAYYPSERWVRHRIVNRTESRIYIDRHCDDYVRDVALHPLETWRTHEVRTHIVDRKNLEANGYATAFSLGEMFTHEAMSRLDPSDFRSRSVFRGGARSTTCLADLGLSWPTTTSDVRKAFRRLAKSAHPDHGGSSEAFIKLRLAYDQALAMVGAP